MLIYRNLVQRPWMAEIDTMKCGDGPDALGDRLIVRVTPRAAANAVKVERQADGTDLVRVYVTTAPEDGKANKAVIEQLARYLKVPKSALTIARGLTGKNKIVHIRR